MFMTRLTMWMDSNPNWHSEYLSNKEKRITAMVTNSTGDQLLMNDDYGSVYNKFINANRILFRSKYISDDKVVIVNVYDSEESYDEFASLVNSSRIFEGYALAGISYNLERIQDITVESSLQDATSKGSFIIQYIHPDYNKDNIPFGDPLKVKS